MLYSLQIFLYYVGMDEQKLTIEQVEKIMQWSYPTALKFASIHGEKGSKVWLIPSGVVWNRITQLEANVKNMRKEFFNVCPSPTAANGNS
jgi:hypothetical protein